MIQPTLHFGKLIYDADKAKTDLKSAHFTWQQSLKRITDEGAFLKGITGPAREPSVVELVEKELGMDVRVETGTYEVQEDNFRGATLSLEKDGKPVTGTDARALAKDFKFDTAIQLLLKAIENYQQELTKPARALWHTINNRG